MRESTVREDAGLRGGVLYMLGLHPADAEVGSSYVLVGVAKEHMRWEGVGWCGGVASQ